MADVVILPAQISEAQPPADPHRPARRRRDRLFWIIAALAVVGAGISGYLFVLTLQQSGQPVGCGPDSDCHAVLSSRWARVADIPISAAGMAVYVSIAGTALFLGITNDRSRFRRLAVLKLVGLLAIAVGAGGWFVYLQAASLGHWCPYCLGVHLCGFLAFGVAMMWLRGQHALPERPPIGLRAFGITIAIAAVLVAGLAVAQMRLVPPPAPARLFIAHLNGSTLELNPADLPAIGPPAAREHVIVLVDYTCHYCRRLHETLVAAESRYGNQVSFTIMPMPLDARCNPYVAKTQKDHLTACDLAKLALAVWKAKPSAYGQFDVFLFAGDRPPDVQSARSRAADLLGGPAALAKAEADPWIQARLNANIDVYRAAGRGQMPKLVFQDRATVAPEAPADVYRFIESELRIKPRQQDATPRPQ